MSAPENKSNNKKRKTAGAPASSPLANPTWNLNCFRLILQFLTFGECGMGRLVNSTWHREIQTNIWPADKIREYCFNVACNALIDLDHELFTTGFKFPGVVVRMPRVGGFYSHQYGTCECFYCRRMWAVVRSFSLCPQLSIPECLAVTELALVGQTSAVRARWEQVARSWDNALNGAFRHMDLMARLRQRLPGWNCAINEEELKGDKPPEIKTTWSRPESETAVGIRIWVRGAIQKKHLRPRVFGYMLRKLEPLLQMPNVGGPLWSRGGRGPYKLNLPANE